MALLTPQFTQDQQYTAAQMRLAQASVAQAGVVGGGDLAVTPGSGLQVNIAAGRAYVPQTVNIEGGSIYNGLYFVVSDAVASPYNTITAPVSNPRVDQVIFRVYDTPELQIGGASYARFEWLTGTETAGAQVTNVAGTGYRAGAAILPANSLRLIDTLRSPGNVSIATNTIIDRRPRANGAQGFRSGADWASFPGSGSILANKLRLEVLTGWVEVSWGVGFGLTGPNSSGYEVDLTLGIDAGFVQANGNPCPNATTSLTTATAPPVNFAVALSPMPVNTGVGSHLFDLFIAKTFVSTDTIGWSAGGNGWQTWAPQYANSFKVREIPAPADNGVV